MSDGLYLPFWFGAIALTAVPLLHWLLLRRPVAVSGRYTALVDRWRHGAPADASEPAMSEAEMIAAMRAMTEQEFGGNSIEAEPEPAEAIGELELPRAPDGAATHVLFLLGLVAGGTLSMLLGSGIVPTLGLHSTLFTEFFGSSPITGGLVLFGGGLLVGAGTRMSGGCTSGHGLCGVSQLQPGSFVATTAFFGAGVATSFALRLLG